MSQKKDFIRQMLPIALAVESAYGLPAEYLLAVSGHETGWNRNPPGDSSFGVKGTGQTIQTHEYVNGQRVSKKEPFRAYASPLNSFVDFARLITAGGAKPDGSFRYGKVVAAAPDVKKMIAEMISGNEKYATDPNYASKVSAVFSSLPNLTAKKNAIRQIPEFIQFAESLRPDRPPENPRARPEPPAGFGLAAPANPRARSEPPPSFRQTAPLPRARPGRQPDSSPPPLPRVRPERASFHAPADPQSAPARPEGRTILPSAATAQANPFSTEASNLTEQSRLIRQAKADPSKAGRIRQMIRTAGIGPVRFGL